MTLCILTLIIIAKITREFLELSYFFAIMIRPYDLSLTQ
jgi:hypothetical protein